MDTKLLGGVAFGSAVFGGIVGAVLVLILGGGGGELPSVVEKLKVNELEVVNLNTTTARIEFGEMRTGRVGKVQFVELYEMAPDGKTQNINLRDGNVICSNKVITGTVNANFLVGKSLIATTNPLANTVRDHKVYAEITAVSGVGAAMALYSETGAFQPSGGDPKQGNALFFGFRDRGLPFLYAENRAQGEAGRYYLLKSKAQEGQGLPAAPDPAGPGENSP